MIFLTEDNNPIATPAYKQGVTVMDGDNISSYEDDDVLYNYYVFNNGELVSFLETDKASGKMVQHVFVKTGNNVYAEPAGKVNYQDRQALFGDIDPNNLVATDVATDISEAGVADRWDETTEILIPIAAIVDGVLIPE